MLRPLQDTLKTAALAPLLFACALPLAACGDDDADDADTESGEAAVTVGVCGQDVSVYDAARALTGGAIIAGRQTDKAGSVYELLGGLIVGMLYNGIDFVALRDADIGFEDGRYTFETGNDTLAFRLFWATDFGDHHTGDPIDVNLFDPKSYIEDVDVSVGGSIRDPDIDYDITWGPLAELVEGDADISGRDPRDLSISLKLHSEAIGFALESVQRDTFEMPITELLGLVTGKFDYQVHMNTPPISVAALPEALKTGGYGVSLSQSYLKSEYFFGDKRLQRTDVTFDDAAFVILEGTDAEGEDAAYWEGEYTGAHATWYKDFGGDAEVDLFMKGLGSTRNPNYTEYYCDAARTQRWGRAEHNAELTGGTLTLTNGKKLNYGLGPVESDDFREGDDPTD